MNKEVFLQSLERLLKGLKKEERKTFLSFYNEMIEDYREDGLTEEEAVKKIGALENIAEEILVNREMGKPISAGKKAGIIVLLILGSPLWGSFLLAGLCLALGGLLLVLSAYVLIWCIPVITGSFCVGGFIFGAVSLAGSLAVMHANTALGVIQLGAGFMSIALCPITGLLTWKLAGVFVRISGKFSKWLICLIKGKRGVKA